MRSIKEIVKSNFIINKSEFINYLVPINTVEEATLFLDSLKKQYPDANHHCYAYIIGKNQETQKYSDDGEPSKTAGMPMIEVLKKQDLTNILAVAIRYFGGIKLGAGGLVRAYTKSVSETLKEATFSDLVTFTYIKISVPFDQIGHVEKYIRDHFSLLDTSYTTEVTYYVELLEDEVDALRYYLTEQTKGIARFEIIKTFEKYV